jgi:cell wall assembly regulator SMI1
LAIEQMTLVKDPVKDADIDAVEAEMGVKVPEPYRRFLLQYNGGRPRPARFVYGKGPYQDSRVHGFACIQQGHINDIRHLVQTFAGRIPKGTMPIARDPAGNLVLIGTTGDPAGKIFFWDHEQEAEEGQEADWRNVSPVADSFDQFLESLHDQKPAH